MKTLRTMKKNTKTGRSDRSLARTAKGKTKVALAREVIMLKAHIKNLEPQLTELAVLRMELGYA